ncbi:MAG: shikimate dehydrogenase [Candidatus Omnitrophota bacterium]
MTKKVHLIGNPVEHSISPQIHNAGFKKLGLDYVYSAIKVADSELEAAANSMRAADVAGFNVTVPHKQNIMKYLDETDDASKMIGAVNCVQNIDGKLKGFNTDSIGFIESLTLDARQAPKGKKVVVLGAGGSARAVTVALCKEAVADLSIYDIDSARAKALAAHLSSEFSMSVSEITDKNTLWQMIINCDILVNTTPIGMHPKVNASPIDEDAPLHKGIFVYDVVYNPPLTKLLKIAHEKDADGMTGLGMLVRQATAAFELFTGQPAPVEVMWEASKTALGL